MAQETLASDPPASAPCEPPAVQVLDKDDKLRCQRGLAFIAAYKVLHATFLFSLGLVALHMVHKDLAEVLLATAHRLRFNPEGHLVKMLLSHVNLVDAKRLREIGFFSFADCILALVEGVGLFYEKAWAEWLTTLVTGSFIPWELYELVRHASPIRLLLLLCNAAVLGYLLWILRKKSAARR